MNKTRYHIELHGILQGIGCRPTVHRLACSFNLAGWVINTSDSVTIEIEGPDESCKRFVEKLQKSIPAPGRLDSISVLISSPLGEKQFLIKNSSQGRRETTPIPPDVAICDECVKELFDPTNRRFLFPFTTCTLCGPRFTVVRSFPYDRERTSMADFPMCHQCLQEFQTPADRRFHSQTNSCSACGPKLSLFNYDGSVIDGDPIIRTIELINNGKILAIKGIGGFHLACDALNEKVVKELRDRKGRAQKPFAIMMPAVDQISNYCCVSEEEKSALRSMASPIVLLKAHGSKLAPSVAPGMGTIGVMLPYAPLHHLLFKHPFFKNDELPKALVMTSGNKSEEPICRDNQEALDRLKNLADAFLVHNREIVLRADDSIVRVIAGKQVVFRRSRGFVPAAFNLNPEDETCGKKDFEEPFSGAVIGSGGDLKNAPAILKGNQIVPGPHVGDLETPVAQDYFSKAICVLQDYLEVKPDYLAFDPHPEYFSSQLARSTHLLATPVYHHHAHAVSLLIEKSMKAPALFAVFDGTGYGTDGTIWGGEFLIADRRSFQRIAHFTTFPLPGSQAAIKEPSRILTGLLWLANGNQIPDNMMNLIGEDPKKIMLWIEIIKRGFNSPMTSSAGRLFDAAAVLAGFRGPVTFESQASMWFEGIAQRHETEKYDIKITDNEILEIDSPSLIDAMAKDASLGLTPSVMSSKFHNSMANIVAEVLEIASKRTGIRVVGLTGGCFQNSLLTERSIEYLGKKGLEILTHSSVPPNDGGIAIGQVATAFEKSRS